MFLGPQLAVGGGRSLEEERGRLGPEEGEGKERKLQVPEPARSPPSRRKLKGMPSQNEASALAPF